MQWHKHADPYDRLLAFLRECWAFFTARIFSPLDLLVIFGALAAQVRGAPDWAITLSLFLWLQLRLTLNPLASSSFQPKTKHE
jgi:hypothetical protein